MRILYSKLFLFIHESISLDASFFSLMGRWKAFSKFIFLFLYFFFSIFRQDTCKLKKTTPHCNEPFWTILGSLVDSPFKKLLWDESETSMQKNWSVRYGHPAPPPPHLHLTLRRQYKSFCCI